jgi:hypothetical protein
MSDQSSRRETRIAATLKCRAPSKDIMSAACAGTLPWLRPPSMHPQMLADQNCPTAQRAAVAKSDHRQECRDEKHPDHCRSPWPRAFRKRNDGDRSTTVGSTSGEQKAATPRFPAERRPVRRRNSRSFAPYGFTKVAQTETTIRIASPTVLEREGRLRTPAQVRQRASRSKSRVRPTLQETTVTICPNQQQGRDCLAPTCFCWHPAATSAKETNR